MSNQDAKSKLSRRDLLKLGASVPALGMSAPPALALLGVILEGQTQQAWAESNDLNPRTLIQITQAGSPPDWTGFKSFLAGPNFNPNVIARTQFTNVNGRYTDAEVNFFDMKGIKVPIAWTHQLPTPNNNYAPASDMLDNLFCIQGINAGNSGHEGAQDLLLLPLGSKQTVNALSADASNTPFAAINMFVPRFRFKSIAGKTYSDANSEGGISSLLSQFRQNAGATFYADKAFFKAALKEILPSVDAAALGRNPAAQALIDGRESALKLAESNFSALTAQWNALLAKYQDLVTRAMYDPSHPVVGFNDLPIGMGGSDPNPNLYEVNNSTPYGLDKLADFRSVIGPQTTVPRLASKFALTEYAVINGLTKSIVFDAGEADKLYDAAGVPRIGLINDQHPTGFYPAVFVTAMRHRAVQACLMELINALKAANVFNDTVIMHSGEFNRMPYNTYYKGGTDHGPEGQSHAYYCGAFKGPLIVGNLAASDPLNHWGRAGRIPSLGRTLGNRDTIATLAHLLRVPSPLSNAPVAVLGANGLVSNIGTTTYI